MRCLVALPFVLLFAGSAAAQSPSLAKRDVENRDLNEPVRRVVPPTPADIQLRARIDGLLQQAQNGQRAFAAFLPRADTAAAAAGPDGSESWIAAQQLLSALEGERVGTPQALAELDTLIATRLNQGDETGLTELQAADAQVSSLSDAQQRELDRLRDRLSR